MGKPQAAPRSEFDLWVGATPAQIILLAESLDARLTDYGSALNAFCDVSEDAERVRIRFGVPEMREYIEGQGVNDFGWITARAEGNGSRLAVQYWDEGASQNPAQQWWELYRDEMERKGWIIVEAAIPPESEPPTAVQNPMHAKILDLWRELYTAREIGDMVGLSPGTVGNIITMLRGKLTKEAVPFHRKS